MFLCQRIDLQYFKICVYNVCNRSLLYLIFMSLQLIVKLEEKCNLLPSSYKKALSADPDEIMYTTAGDVGIYFDDNGQHQVFTS